MEPLALLHLAAAIQGKPQAVPEVWPSDAFFECAHDQYRLGPDGHSDNDFIYSQRRAPSGAEGTPNPGEAKGSGLFVVSVGHGSDSLTATRTHG